MYDFDFGINDLLDEDSGKRTLAKWAAGGLGLVFLVLSCLTTAAFFFQYAPGLGFLFGPDLAPYVAGIVGVLTLDLACLVWAFVRANGCSSQGQQTLALAVGVVDLVGALAVSGLYVLLSGGRLDAGVYTAAGQLTDFGQGLHLFGTLVITAGLIINFASVWAFQVLSAETKKATQQTALAAAVSEGRYRVAHSHTKQAVQKSLQTIGDRMPYVTDEVAAANAARYAVMGKQQQAVLSDEGLTGQPSSNGQHTPRPTNGRQ